MHSSLLLFIFSIITAVRAVQSSSSSGSFDWRSFLEDPIEHLKEGEKEPTTTELTSGEVVSLDQKMRENAKETQRRKKPIKGHYQKEKEHTLLSPQDKDEQTRMKKQKSQKRYREKIGRETGYSSRQSAYEARLYRLHRMGLATEEQKQELQDIRSKRKVRVDRNTKKRKERIQGSKPK